MDNTPTAEQEIAQWMVAQIREVGTLKQEDAIAYVRSEYGEQYVFISEHGHVSLEKEIKKHFASFMVAESPGIVTDFSGPGLNKQKHLP